MISSKDFKFDDTRRVVEVDGISYAYELFASFGVHGFDIGTLFKIISRKDDSISIQRIDKKELYRRRRGDV